MDIINSRTQFKECYEEYEKNFPNGAEERLEEMLDLMRKWQIIYFEDETNKNYIMRLNIQFETRMVLLAMFLRRC